MGYRCADCNPADMPPLAELARTVAAAVARGDLNPDIWWRPLVSWVEFQGEAVAWLRVRDLRCPRHAALLAALVVDSMRRMCVTDGAPVEIDPLADRRSA